jgi:hypothetical protein
MGRLSAGGALKDVGRERAGLDAQPLGESLSGQAAVADPAAALYRADSRAGEIKPAPRPLSSPALAARTATRFCGDVVWEAF